MFTQRSYAEQVLERSKAALDINAMDAHFILTVINDCWEDEDDGVHYCLRGRCPAGCGGSKVEARKNIRKAIILVAGGPCGVALNYRWKGYNEAVSFCYRARACKDYLRRGLELTYDAKNKAAEDALRAAFDNLVDGAGSASMVANQQAVRGGRVIRWMQGDHHGRSIEIAVTLNQPLQGYLDRSLKAENAVTKLQNVYLATPTSECVSVAPDVLELKNDAIHRNLKILSGEAGVSVVKRFSKLQASFRDPLWQGLHLHDDEKHKHSETVVVTAADAWYRLVFRYKEQARHQIFQVCADPVWRKPMIDRVVLPLIEKRNRCKRCVDAAFTHVWCQRLAAPQRTRRGHRELRNVLSLAQILGTRCERKHIVGQELRGRKRGRVLTCTSLSKVTYNKGARTGFLNKQRFVENKVLGGPAEKRRFSTVIQKFELHRARRGRTDRQGAAKLKAWRATRTKSRNSRGLDLFVRERFPEAGADVGVMERRARCTQMWKDLTPAERSVYNGRAQARAEEGQNEIPDLAHFGQLDQSELGRTKLKRARTESAMRSLKMLREHPAWRAGANVDAYGVGLRPDLVLPGTNNHFAAEADRLFGFSPIAKPKLDHVSKPFQTCAILYGGVCETDPFFEQVQIAMRNFYVEMVNIKVHKDGPVLINLSLPDLPFSPAIDSDGEFYAFARFWNKDQTSTLLQAETVAAGPPRKLILSIPDETLVINTFQRVVSRILVSVMNGAPHLDVGDLSLTLTVYKHKRCSDADGYGIEIVETKARKRLSLKDRLNMPRTTAGAIDVLGIQIDVIDTENERKPVLSDSADDDGFGDNDHSDKDCESVISSVDDNSVAVEEVGRVSLLIQSLRAFLFNK